MFCVSSGGSSLTSGLSGVHEGAAWHANVTLRVLREHCPEDVTQSWLAVQIDINYLIRNVSHFTVNNKRFCNVYIRERE